MTPEQIAWDRSLCPACHCPDHDPGSCPNCPRCELHTDEAFDWVLRVEPELVAAHIDTLTAAPLDVRRVVEAIHSVANRHGIKADHPRPEQSLANIYGYSTTPADMDAQIAAEYERLRQHR